MKIKLLKAGLLVLAASFVAAIFLVSNFDTFFKVSPLKATSFECSSVSGHFCSGNCASGHSQQGNCNNGTCCDKEGTVAATSTPIPTNAPGGGGTTSCEAVGFFCVTNTCPAGHNQSGGCANGTCCDTTDTLTPQNVVNAFCVYDNNTTKCSTRSPGYKCSVPVGEMGMSANCTNNNSSGTETGCTSDYPNCNVAGTYCIGSTTCEPSDRAETNCVIDSSCGGTTTTTTTTTNPTSTPTPTPTPTVTPTPTATPTVTPTVTPTSTPNGESYLKICKYNDSNDDGSVDNGEGLMDWNFYYSYSGSQYEVGSHWWYLNGGCVTSTVPSGIWINVWEENRGGWNLTNIYSDGSGVGAGSYNYVASAGQTKTVWFLNYYQNSYTPTPTATPNYCNGTCGSNYNCQSGYFCYNGNCRVSNCQNDSTCGCAVTPTPTPTAPPVVLGATAPPVLPKTGSNLWEVVAGLVGTMGTGFWIFRKFKLI